MFRFSVILHDSDYADDLTLVWDRCFFNVFFFGVLMSGEGRFPYAVAGVEFVASGMLTVVHSILCGEVWLLLLVWLRSNSRLGFLLGKVLNWEKWARRSGSHDESCFSKCIGEVLQCFLSHLLQHRYTGPSFTKGERACRPTIHCGSNI